MRNEFVLRACHLSANKRIVTIYKYGRVTARMIKHSG